MEEESENGVKSNDQLPHVEWRINYPHCIQKQEQTSQEKESDAGMLLCIFFIVNIIS